MGELEPCPFCGGEARPTAHLEYSWFAPVCNSCGVRGPTVGIERGLDPQKLRELMDTADTLWNARTTNAAPTEPSVEHWRKAISMWVGDATYRKDAPYLNWIEQRARELAQEGK